MLYRGDKLILSCTYDLRLHSCEWWLFPRVRVFFENVWQFIPRLRFFPSFLKWRLAYGYYFHSLGQDQSTVAQRAETTVTECSLTSCEWARFLIGSHTMPGQRHSQPTPTSLDQSVCMFRCNLPSSLLAEWPDSFMCHCGNTGVEQTPNKSQHTKLTLEKKILPPLLPGFELATFQSWVWHSNQQAIPDPLARLYFLLIDSFLLILGVPKSISGWPWPELYC